MGHNRKGRNANGVKEDCTSEDRSIVPPTQDSPVQQRAAVVCYQTTAGDSKYGNNNDNTNSMNNKAKHSLRIAKQGNEQTLQEKERKWNLTY